jgi:hypothetical protein
MRNLLCIVFLLFVRIGTAAQDGMDTITDNFIYPVKLFYNSLGEQSPLYNGREYFDYSKTIHSGHPYYSSSGFKKGSIVFDDMIFEDAMILYDIIKEKIIIRHFAGMFKIELDIEKIREFTLSGKHFVHVPADSLAVIEEGFYEKLYDGKTDLYAKRKKTIREETSRNEILNIVDEKNSFYVKKNGVFHSVNNIKALLQVFNDRKESIRNHLKEKRIKFRKNREAAVLMAVKYYDSLSN